MSVLYDKLYRSQYIGQINIREYIPALVEEIISIFPCKTKVEFVSRIDNISLNEKTISVLGILINEMITNAMKHAFNAQDEGLICISVTREEEICFVFEDNGKGLPESITMENSEGFGMQLIGMLVEQLNGTVAIERENGTRYSIFFKA